MNTSLDINKIYELIDLYKYASVTGERVEIIITPYEKDGKWDDSKRLFTIGLQGGMSRDRDTFVIENKEEFDKYVLPQLLAYYSSDDTLGNWDIVIPEVDNVTAKGVAETESGNLVYLESFNQNIYKEVLEQKEKVEQTTKYKKDPLTDEQKIWDEVILYAKRRRIAQDFYRSASFTEEEKEVLYNFIVNVIESEKGISISNDKKYREKNEKIFEELFKDKDKLINLGLTEEIINKVVNTNGIKKLASLAGTEKRARRRLDLSNPEIQEKIEFAIVELDKIDYYNLRNASAVQFEDGKFVSSQPKVVRELKENYDLANIPDDKKLKYKSYCDEILGYLEKKAKNNRKVVTTEVVTPQVSFEKYSDVVIDSYDKLKETLDLVRHGKLDEEHYEIIVEPDSNNPTRRLVRISLLNGISRGDLFNFEFNNGEEFDVEFEKILSDIRKEDPNFKSIISFVNMPDGETRKDALHESQQGNEILIKKASDSLAYRRSEPISEKTEVEEETKEQAPVSDDLFAKLQRLETEINEEARRQDEEMGLVQEDTIVSDNPVIEEQRETIDSDTVEADFDKLHEYVMMYEIGNSNGPLQIFYRDAGREYIPSSDEEKRDIEFATYWSAMVGINESKDDVVVGEKFAFGEQGRKLFNILDVHFRESLRRGIDIDFDSLKEQFVGSGVDYSDKIFDRLFKNQYYIDYVTQYYRKSLNLDKNLNKLENIDVNDIEKNEKLNELKDAENKVNEKNIEKINYLDEDLSKAAYKQAKELIEKEEMNTLREGAIEQAHELQEKNEKADLINGAEEQAHELQEKNEKADLINGAEEQAELLIQLRDNLFEIVQNTEEKEPDPELIEISDAFDVVESYATAEQPSSFKIFFSKETPDSAEVIISNGVGVDETVMYQRTFDVEKVKNDIIPLICSLYAKDNIVTYNSAYDVPNTRKAGLVVVGTNEKTLQISNADKEIVSLCQETLTKELAKNNTENNNLAR